MDKRKYKGRVVFQGNNVYDGSGLAAIFGDQCSSASFLSTSKIIDVISLMPGCAGGQSDAPSAYIQANLYEGDEKGCIETWVIIPREEWQPSWAQQYSSPVVRLKLALYGHPDSGLFWERKCAASLKAVGFEPVPDWECTDTHDKLGLVLSVYVDDFEMAGKKENPTKVGG